MNIETIKEIKSKLNSNITEDGLIDNILNTIPPKYENEFRISLLFDKDDINRNKNGYLSLPQILHYVKKAVEQSSRENAINIVRNLCIDKQSENISKDLQEKMNNGEITGTELIERLTYRATRQAFIQNGLKELV